MAFNPSLLSPLARAPNEPAPGVESFRGDALHELFPAEETGIFSLKLNMAENATK